MFLLAGENGNDGLMQPQKRLLVCKTRLRALTNTQVRILAWQGETDYGTKRKMADFSVPSMNFITRDPHVPAQLSSVFHK
jgi:hypothetical protein